MKKNIPTLPDTQEELGIVNTMPKARLLQLITVVMKLFPTMTLMCSWNMLPQKDLLPFLAMLPDGVSIAVVFLMDAVMIRTLKSITPFR